MTVRVLHCDDSEAFRVLVREMLHDEDGIDLVGEADGAESAIAQARALAPDVTGHAMPVAGDARAPATVLGTPLRR
jgi:chemotaxis response regulator CheB